MHTQRTPPVPGGRCGSGWALAAAGLLALAGCAAHRSSAAAAAGGRGRVEEAAGIRIEALRLSAAGTMLDFRYRVIDQARAAGLLDGRQHPYLLDGRGARLGVPETPILGLLRQTARNGKVSPDHTYFVLFANPGRFLRPGDQVTLVVGDARVTDLTVE